MLKPSKPLSIALGISGIAIFAITSLMILSAGVSSGSTGGGQQLMGWGNIVLHVTCLMLMGIATGYLFRARIIIGALITLLFVIGGALLSAKNLLDFAAAEQSSLRIAQAAQVKAQEDHRVAQLEATKKRQESVTKMTEGAIKWAQGTAKDAKGRLERKDNLTGAMEQTANLIKEYSKIEIAAPEAPKVEVVLMSGSGTNLLAKATGIDADMIQLISSIYQNLLLIALESIIWPLAAFFWPPKGYYAAEAAALAAMAIPLTPVGPQKTLAPPKKDKPVTIQHEPTAEWRQLLDAIDYPSGGTRFKGAPRAKDKREHVALRHLVWLQAHSETGDISTEEMDELYKSYNAVDHRVPWATRIVKKELLRLGKKFGSKSQANGTTYYNIPSQTVEKMRALLEKHKVLTATEPFTVPQVALPEVKTGDGESKSSSIIPFWRSRTAGGGLH